MIFHSVIVSLPCPLDHSKFERIVEEEFIDWAQTERGKWVVEHAVYIKTAAAYHALTDEFIGRIYGHLIPKDLTFYHLKWSV